MAVYNHCGIAPAVGYVFQEDEKYTYRPEHHVPGRKIVILGDTYDSRGIIPLCYDASLLVHEATQMAIPRDLARRVTQFRKGCSEEEARKAALKHGHSTAAMAGEFAREIRAKRLFLNHFSVKYVQLLSIIMYETSLIVAKAFPLRREGRSTQS